MSWLLSHAGALVLVAAFPLGALLARVFVVQPARARARSRSHLQQLRNMRQWQEVAESRLNNGARRRALRELRKAKCKLGRALALEKRQAENASGRA